MDISLAFQWLVDSFSAAGNWWVTILNSIGGAASVVLAAIFMVLVVTMLFVPLRGSGASDRAKRKEDK